MDNDEAKKTNEEMDASTLEPVNENDEVMQDVEAYEEEMSLEDKMEQQGSEILNSTSKITKTTTRQKKNAFNDYDGEVFNPTGFYNVETDDAKKNKTYLELVASKNSGKILEGQVTGVKEMDGQVIAVVQYKEFSILIPATELIWIEQNRYKTREDIEELSRRIKMRIGSTISFLATYVDIKEMIFIASAIKAMGIKAFTFYVKPQSTGLPRIQKGMIVPGIVTCATSSFITVESFGAEFNIRENEIFWHRQDMINNFYHVGDTVMYKVLDVKSGIVTRLNGDKYKRVVVTGSIRQTKKNPAEIHYSKYEVGQSVSAIVTHVSESGVHLIMGTKDYPTMEVVCHLPASSDIPVVGDTCTLTITKKVDEEKHIYGALSPIGRSR